MANRKYNTSKKSTKTQYRKKRWTFFTRNQTSYKAWLTVLVLAAIGTITTSISRAETETPQWNVICNSSHSLTDDPIVFPNQSGASHLHTFFGNKSTNASTTTASLLATSPSTCGRNMGGKDLSSYWIPALYKRNADGTGAPVDDRDQRMTIYYRRVGEAGGPRIKPFPQGLRIIAGTASATTPQPQSVTYWQCGNGGPQYSAMPPSCPNPSEPIRADVMFPSCWDGVNLDSPNHKSHMAYSASSGACPASHPVSLPQLNLEIWYDGISEGAPYYLASGGVYSMHADFFAAWDNQTQNALVEACLNDVNDCTGIHLSDDERNLFVPDYDEFPISVVLGNYATSSPWSGAALQAPSPQPVASAPPRTSSQPQPVQNEHSAHASHAAGAPVDTSGTDDSASTTASDVQNQKSSGDVSTFANTIAKETVEKVRSSSLAILGLASLALVLVCSAGWLAYRYVHKKATK